MNKIPSAEYPPIKSYVLRQGRRTPAQRRALENAWSRYGVNYDAQSIALSEIFDRQAPCVLEIGFGHGESLSAQAVATSDKNFIGIEVHSPGVGALLAKAEKQGLSNLRVFQHDAVDVLRYVIPDESLETIQIFFPDPWPKNRHHKRRLIQSSFVHLLTRKLKSGGRLHCATDWKNYAEHMMEVLSVSEGLLNVAGERVYYPDAYSLRPLTKFEQRGLRLNHKIRDLVFHKK